MIHHNKSSSSLLRSGGVDSDIALEVLKGLHEFLVTVIGQDLPYISSFLLFLRVITQNEYNDIHGGHYALSSKVNKFLQTIQSKLCSYRDGTIFTALVQALESRPSLQRRSSHMAEQMVQLYSKCLILSYSMFKHEFCLECRSEGQETTFSLDPQFTTARQRQVFKELMRTFANKDYVRIFPGWRVRKSILKCFGGLAICFLLGWLFVTTYIMNYSDVSENGKLAASKSAENNEGMLVWTPNDKGRLTSNKLSANSVCKVVINDKGKEKANEDGVLAASSDESKLICENEIEEDCCEVSNVDLLFDYLYEIGDWQVLCSRLHVKKGTVAEIRNNPQMPQKLYSCVEAFVDLGEPYSCWEKVVSTVCGPPFFKRKLGKTIATDQRIALPSQCQ